MPGALHDVIVKLPLAQRASHVGAPVVEAGDLTADLEQRDVAPPERRARRFPLPEVALRARIDAHGPAHSGIPYKRSQHAGRDPGLR